MFICGVHSHLEATEELAAVHRMRGRITGENICEEVEKSLFQYNLQWKQLKCVTNDGGRDMFDSKRGFAGQLYKDSESARCPKPMAQ